MLLLLRLGHPLLVVHQLGILVLHSRQQPPQDDALVLPCYLYSPTAVVVEPIWQLLACTKL
jgi:hypothetical protein